MNNNINKPELKRSMAKDHETHEKERQEMIAKMTPSERSKYLEDYEKCAKILEYKELLKRGTL